MIIILIGLIITCFVYILYVWMYEIDNRARTSTNGIIIAYLVIVISFTAIVIIITQYSDNEEYVISEYEILETQDNKYVSIEQSGNNIGSHGFVGSETVYVYTIKKKNGEIETKTVDINKAEIVTTDNNAIAKHIEKRYKSKLADIMGISVFTPEQDIIRLYIPCSPVYTDDR